MADNRKHDQIQWVSTGDPATVDSATPQYPGQLGGMYTDALGKQWQYVQGDSSMSVSPFPGATLWWSDRTNYKVTTVATNRGLVAGCIPVFQKDGTSRVASKTSGNYFFIQKGGKAKIKFVDAPTSAPNGTGKIVIPSATAGKADCLAAGSAATYPPLGVESDSAYDAANTEGFVILDIADAID